MVHEFTFYQESLDIAGAPKQGVATVTETHRHTLSIDNKVNRRLGRAAITFARLSSSVWQNRKLTTNSKFAIYMACVVSVLLCSSRFEASTPGRKTTQYLSFSLSKRGSLMA